MVCVCDYVSVCVWCVYGVWCVCERVCIWGVCVWCVCESLCMVCVYGVCGGYVRVCVVCGWGRDLPLAWFAPVHPDCLPLGSLGGWAQARWLWLACEGGSLPGVPAASRRSRSRPTLLCCRLVVRLLRMILPPDPVETAGIFALHLSSVPLVVLRSSLAGPTLPLQTQAMCSEAEGLAALSLVPRPWGTKVLLATSFSFYCELLVFSVLSVALSYVVF